MLFKKTYSMAAMLAVMGLLSANAASSDIDLKQVGYYGFTALPPALISQRDTLLLSDSPEYVGPVGGVLSAGSINGKGRIYFYHVNEMSEPHKIAIVLENTLEEPNQITVYRELKSVATPDYFAAGRDLSRKELEQPLTDKPLYSFTMAPKSRQLVFTDLEHSPVQRDALFTGIVDLQSSGSIFARVMMIPMSLNSIDASYWVNNLPIDHVRLRGTFTGAQREMAVSQDYNTTLGGAYVEIGNDREDRFVEGVDEMDNKAYVKDAGNYGISYSLKIPTSGEEPFRLYLNPMGGGYSGSFTVKSQRRWQHAPSESITYHVGGEDGLMALGHNTIMDSRYMGNYYGGDTLTIDFMPAGASNLPIRFLLIPEALANPQYAKVMSMTEAGQKALEAEAKKEADDAAKKVVVEEKAAVAKEQAQEKAHVAAEEARKAAEKAEAAHKAAQAKQAELDRKEAEEAAKASAKAEVDAQKAREAQLKADAKAQAALKAAEEKAIADAIKAEEARIAAEQKAEAQRQAAEAKRAEEERKAEAARIAAEEKAEAARIAAEQKRLEEERKAEVARIEAERKAAEAAAKDEAERLEAARKAEERRLEAERKAEEQRVAAARKAEEQRLAAIAKAEEEARKAEEAKIREENRRAEEVKKAEERRLAAIEKAKEEARKAEEARLAEEARKLEEARRAEENRKAAEARKAERARIAAEQAEAARKAEEARRLAEKRIREYEIAEQQAKEARRRAEVQREAQRKAAERAESIRLAAERQIMAKRNAELARQKLAEEKEAALIAAQGGKRRSFSELDDVNTAAYDTSEHEENAISIDELLKPKR